MFIKKTFPELVNDIENRLVRTSDITYIEPGSLVKSFIEVIAEELDMLYETIEFNQAMSHVSTAEGGYLDKIGESLQCERSEYETDEEYRERIKNQIYIVAGGNETAIKFAVLQNTNVIGMEIEEFTHGAGSFTVIVELEDYSKEHETLESVSSIINNVKTKGIYSEVRTPRPIPISITVKVFFKEKTSINEVNTIKQIISTSARRRIEESGSNYMIDTELIIQDIKKSSDKVIGSEIVNLIVDGKPTSQRNIASGFGERFYIESLTIL